MEARPAAKAMKTLSPSKGMKSRSIGRETRGGRNACGPKAMETRARAAKIMKSRDAAGVNVSAAGAQARGRRAAPVNMVRRAGITRTAGKILDGIYLVRSGTVGLVEVPTIAVAAGVAAAGGRILGSFDRREAQQRPEAVSSVIAHASLRLACKEQQSNTQGNRKDFSCHLTIFLMSTPRPEICSSAMPAAAVSAGRESPAAAMEASAAAKAMKTLSPSNAMESGSIGQETRAGRNVAGPEAMETRAGAANVMRDRGAAVMAAGVRARVQGRSMPGAAVSVVRRPLTPNANSVGTVLAHPAAAAPAVPAIGTTPTKTIAPLVAA
jgi:hypothetical protein